MPFLTPVFGEGSPTKIGYRRKGTLILTSLLEDLVKIGRPFADTWCHSSPCRAEGNFKGSSRFADGRLKDDQGIVKIGRLEGIFERLLQIYE